jgi:mRNA-degrading endonuclease RelE of RelBE toxin-antitoxin system
MRDTLCRELVKESEMLRREMVAFLRKRFNVDVSPTRITRTLQTLQWTRKNTRRVARQRNLQLRHYYHYRLKLGGYRLYYLIFLDESGLDRSIGVRLKGWAPKGVTPMEIARFQREERFQVLAAYT